jgi:hypothetical protein
MFCVMPQNLDHITLRFFDMSFRHPSADIVCPSCLAEKIELAFQDHRNTICKSRQDIVELLLLCKKVFVDFATPVSG